jgi:hypothetical protein
MGATVNMHQQYEDFVSANQQFQREQWALNSTKPQEVANSLFETAFAKFPSPLRPLLRASALGLVSPETVAQLKLPPSPKLLRATIKSILRTLT